MPESHVVITISRNKGAGGSEIGRSVAARLGFAFLDRELLTTAAERLKEPSEHLESRDERRLPVLERPATFYALGIPFAQSSPPPVCTVETKRLFEVQTSLIEESVARGPVVIVGRAAHWILRDQPLLLSVFLHAPFEARVSRTRRILQLASDNEAAAIVSDCDRTREEFLKWITGRSWGKPTDYHFCVDTCHIGIQPTIELLIAAAEILRQGLHLRERNGL